MKSNARKRCKVFVAFENLVSGAAFRTLKRYDKRGVEARFQTRVRAIIFIRNLFGLYSHPSSLLREVIGRRKVLDKPAE